jgi:dihydroorotase-like cyclic amidohydrolase
VLIANSERGDVRIEQGLIAETGALTAREGEAVIDAKGGALLPGLHDHHILHFVRPARCSQP